MQEVASAMSDWMIEWLIEWMNEWLIEWMNEWMIDWLIDWMNEWLIEWLIEIPDPTGISRISNIATDFRCSILDARCSILCDRILETDYGPRKSNNQNLTSLAFPMNEWMNEIPNSKENSGTSII